MIQPSLPSRFARVVKNVPKPARIVLVSPAVPPGNAHVKPEDWAVRVFLRNPYHRVTRRPK